MVAVGSTAGGTTTTTTSGGFGGANRGEVEAGSVGGAPGVRPSTLVISPASSVLPSGSNEQLAAATVSSDGSSYDVTAFASWSVDPANVVQVSGGRVTAIGLGVATITATAGALSGQATVTVPQNTLTKITLSPDPASADVGGVVAFVATGTYSDGTMGNINSRVKWTIDDPTVAMLAANVATGIAPGTTTVHASIGPVTGPRSASATLTISEPRDR